MTAKKLHNSDTEDFLSVTHDYLKQNTEDHTHFADELSATLNIGPYDVLCGRQKEVFRNVGNRRFRVTVSLAVNQYMAARSRVCKSKVICSVTEQVKATGGRFLKWQENEWVELNEKRSREKVGHALRDMVSARERAMNREKRCSEGSFSGFIRHPRYFNPRYSISSTASTAETSLNDSPSQQMEVVSDENGNALSNDEVLDGMLQLCFDIAVDQLDEIISWEGV